jgi:GNAT superfamily N-acetyltransferase
LSRRSFRHLLTRGHAVTLLEEEAERIRGYVLLLFSRGTSMARLYSIAVHPDFAQRRIGDRLLEAAEAAALERDCVSMRLEVRRDNPPSLKLFHRHGYRPFKEVLDYYEDHMAALRFEKRLAPQLDLDRVKVPYYPQTLDFTCGPAALMMAMKALDPTIELNRRLELRLMARSHHHFHDLRPRRLRSLRIGAIGLSDAVLIWRFTSTKTGRFWWIRCAARRKRKSCGSCRRTGLKSCANCRCHAALRQSGRR